MKLNKFQRDRLDLTDINSYFLIFREKRGSSNDFPNTPCMNRSLNSFAMVNYKNCFLFVLLTENFDWTSKNSHRPGPVRSECCSCRVKYPSDKMLRKCGTKDESEDHGLQATKETRRQTRDPPWLQIQGECHWNPKQGYQWPYERDPYTSKCLTKRKQQIFKKKKRFAKCRTYIECMLLTFVSGTQVSAIDKPWDLEYIV